MRQDPVEVMERTALKNRFKLQCSKIPLFIIKDDVLGPGEIKELTFLMRPAVKHGYEDRKQVSFE